ncbi:hypothetical protein HFX_1126 [Haloferax mediterranei ATCC 33500]|uniref:Uncharacterized protein n=1 Tax=Haloferax mediterranei (strain ATCC 33500 / DSM 1411 / JCM 8866 / NBRC 14739 / NCIMB 2177 / R-4) TaxID=523841 RepID=I3R3N1_HALMT|nr:hypothetical protein HFX_1126 [Haloferax mediterranei ATCC 33500]
MLSVSSKTNSSVTAPSSFGDMLRDSAYPDVSPSDTDATGQSVGPVTFNSALMPAALVMYVHSGPRP